MVAIGKLFGTKGKKRVLWIFGQNVPKPGRGEVGTEAEAVTMAGDRHWEEAGDDGL